MIMYASLPWQRLGNWMAFRTDLARAPSDRCLSSRYTQVKISVPTFSKIHVNAKIM